jgi:Leucine-rich repeat (LRR) protein
MICINSNRISFIKPSSFSQLSVLQNLRLDNNLLTYLYNDTFANLFQLTHLNLSYNQLEVIDKSLFSDLYKLEILDLSFNRLKSIESLSLSSLLSLEIIYINYNSDSLILSKDAFYGLKSIVDIYISFNTFSRWENEESLFVSLKAKNERFVNDVVYYRSINILYDFNYSDPKINCTLVLKFLKNNVQVNLKDDYHLSIFLSFCQKLDLFLI